MTEIKDENNWTGMEIAVIGIAGRFPGAKNIDEFWDNLKQGVESISFFSDQELIEAGIAPERVNHPAYVKAKGMLADIEYFDAAFFNYTALEAETMDPQLRLFHESCWEALENAGYDPWSYKGLIGIYTGASHNYLWLARFLSRLDQLIENESFQLESLNSNSSYCTRIAYKLNLRGPCVSVQTACSTSLVAIHLACQGLLAGECDMALTGGVTLTLPKKSGYLYQEGMLHSLKGHVRAFDSRSDGTVFGNGVGVVVLKPLENAIADGDVIHAIVKGSAINNDGCQRVGFTAPGTNGQAAVIRAALRSAEVEPESISYIETHGTGTALGDSIEIDALILAFRTGKTGFCRIGSVKSNIGHSDTAAGVAGFIKTILALKYRMIPPSLNFESPNPEIDFENSPFRVNTTLTEWITDACPLRAGVNSFGLGGSNAHVILEQAPVISHSSLVIGEKKERKYRLFLLSARTKTVLDKMTKNLEEYFKNNPEMNLADAAYTLQVGRRAFEWRRMWVFPGTSAEGDRVLDALALGQLQGFTSVVSQIDEIRPVIFMFPGQGAQYVNMGLGLYKTEPLFREQMDRCFEILNGLLDYDIRKIIYPGTVEVSSPAGKPPAACDLHLSPDINQTEIAQPLLFIFEYSLAWLIMQWGIKPQAMIGYSIGEYTAACLSGVFTLEDAIKVVVARGKLIGKLPTGTMLSVPLSREDLKPFLTVELSIAIDNGPSCIVSGPAEAIAAIQDELKKQRCLCIPLPNSHAIHSPMMKPILKEFETYLEKISLNGPQIPYISNVTGDWIGAREAAAPRYWTTHLTETVRYAEGIRRLMKEHNPVFIEIGPGRDLNTLLVRHKQGNDQTDTRAVNLIKPVRNKTPGDYYFINKLGQLWTYGVKIDWNEFYKGEQRNRIPLPTYPFERYRFWRDHDVPVLKSGERLGTAGTFKKKDIADVESQSLVEAEGTETTECHTRFQRPGLSTPYAAPQDDIEKELAKIWQNLFGIEQIGVRDDFFDLGGDSLIAITLSSRIQKKLHIEIPLAEFFNRTTIETLAQYIPDKAEINPYFSIESLEKKEYYPLSPGQVRLYIKQQLEPNSTAYNMPSIFVLKGSLDRYKFEEIIKKIIGRHEVLRTSFGSVKGDVIQKIHNTVPFKMEYYNCGEEEAIEKIKHLLKPFDLSQAPLFRVELLHICKEKYFIFFDMHHIISDGTSSDILIDDFVRLYDEQSLMPLPIQYKDYATWYKKQLNEEVLRVQEEYWLTKLEGFEFTQLPFDHYDLYACVEGKAEYQKIDTPLYDKIETFCNKHSITKFVFMITIFENILAMKINQMDITIGIPISIRNHPDLKNIMGVFLNVLLIRSRISEKEKFLNNLVSNKKTVMEALNNQDYPYELLDSRIKTKKSGGLFSILFNYFPVENSKKTSTADFEIHPFENQEVFPKFDLTLYIVDFRAQKFMELNLVYKNNVYEADSIKCLLEGIIDVIQCVLTDEEIILSQLALSMGRQEEDNDDFYREFEKMYEND